MPEKKFSTEELLEAALFSHPLFDALNPELKQLHLQKAENLLDRAENLALYYDHKPNWREVLDDLLPQFKAWTKTLLASSEGGVGRSNGLSLRLEAVFNAKRNDTSPDDLHNRFTQKKKTLTGGILPRTSGIRHTTKRGAFNN